MRESPPSTWATSCSLARASRRSGSQSSDLRARAMLEDYGSADVALGSPVAELVDGVDANVSDAFPHYEADASLVDETHQFFGGDPEAPGGLGRSQRFTRHCRLLRDRPIPAYGRAQRSPL